MPLESIRHCSVGVLRSKLECVGLPPCAGHHLFLDTHSTSTVYLYSSRCTMLRCDTSFRLVSWTECLCDRLMIG
jgi:hypothetical protein